MTTFISSKGERAVLEAPRLVRRCAGCTPEPVLPLIHGGNLTSRRPVRCPGRGQEVRCKVSCFWPPPTVPQQDFKLEKRPRGRSVSQHSCAGKHEHILVSGQMHIVRKPPCRARTRLHRAQAPAAEVSCSVVGLRLQKPCKESCGGQSSVWEVSADDPAFPFAGCGLCTPGLLASSP